MVAKSRTKSVAKRGTAEWRRRGLAGPARAGDAVDLSPLTALVGFCVRVAQLQVFAQFHRELWRRHRLHPGAYSALVAIRTNPGVQPGVLALALAVKRPNMTKLLDALEEDGWLQRRWQKDDGRKVALFLTAEGERRIAAIAEEVATMDAQATACLTRSERAQLVGLLGKVSSHLRELNADRSS